MHKIALAAAGLAFSTGAALAQPMNQGSSMGSDSQMGNSSSSMQQMHRDHMGQGGMHNGRMQQRGMRGHDGMSQDTMGRSRSGSRSTATGSDAAFNGGGVILEGPPGAPAPMPQALASDPNGIVVQVPVNGSRSDMGSNMNSGGRTGSNMNSGSGMSRSPMR